MSDAELGILLLATLLAVAAPIAAVRAWRRRRGRLHRALREFLLEVRAALTGAPRPRKATLLYSKDGTCTLVQLPSGQLRSLDRGFRGKAAIKRWRKIRRTAPHLRAFLEKPSLPLA